MKRIRREKAIKLRSAAVATECRFLRIATAPLGSSESYSMIGHPDMATPAAVEVHTDRLAHSRGMLSTLRIRLGLGHRQRPLTANSLG